MEEFNKSIESFKHISAGFFYASVLTLILSSCSLEKVESTNSIEPQIIQPVSITPDLGAIHEELIPPVTFDSAQEQ